MWNFLVVLLLTVTTLKVGGTLKKKNHWV